MEFISIKGVAKKLGCSYYVARNRLNRCKEAEQYKHKLEHTVIYDHRVLTVICNQ
jgi:hypothetical protein